MQALLNNLEQVIYRDIYGGIEGACPDDPVGQSADKIKLC
jgi:hypothetical protein